MYEETKVHSKLCFVTLTYAPEHVPQLVDTSSGEVSLSLNKKHLQDWFKRIRRNFQLKKIKAEFKYFACGEYGPRTLRPHYHIFFFGLDTKLLSDALIDWQIRYGFTLAKDVTYYPTDLLKTSKYVSKYCSKGVFENPKVKEKNVEPAFRLVSKNMGINYVEEMKDFHLHDWTYSKDKDSVYKVLDKRFVVIDNKAYSMPRYYREKIYGTKNLLSFSLQVASLARADDLFNQQLESLQAQNPSWDYAQTVRYLLSQNDSAQMQKSKQSFEQLARFYDKSKL